MGRTNLFFELGVSPRELVVDITREVFEAGCREGCELLTGLVAFWMEVVPEWEERYNCPRKS